MNKSVKKRFSGVFRDGGAGKGSVQRFRQRRKKLLEREDKLMALTGVPYGPGEETGWEAIASPANCWFCSPEGGLGAEERHREFRHGRADP